MCRDVRREAPAIRFVLLTSAHDDEALAGCLLCGASDYQTKLVNSSVILDSVRRVGGGRDLIPAEDAARARERLLSQVEHDAQERAVLTAMLDGWTDDRIAAELGLDDETVRTVVGRLISRATSED